MKTSRAKYMREYRAKLRKQKEAYIKRHAIKLIKQMLNELKEKT